MDLKELLEVIQIVMKYDPKATINKGPDNFYAVGIWLSENFKGKEIIIDYDGENHDCCSTFSKEDNQRLVELGWTYDERRGPVWWSFW